MQDRGGIPGSEEFQSPIPAQYPYCNGGDTNAALLIRVTWENGVSDLGQSLAPNGTRTPGDTKRRSLTGRLCESRDERWFVESLLVLLDIRRRRQQRTATPQVVSSFRFTHNQVRQIVSLRFGVELPVWDNTQFDRLKRKYISRVGAKAQLEPATRFELFREVAKGQRARGSARGTPSVYQPTGIEIFFCEAAR